MSREFGSGEALFWGLDVTGRRDDRRLWSDIKRRVLLERIRTMPVPEPTILGGLPRE